MIVLDEVAGPITNAYHTGNTIVDLWLCVLIPLVLSAILSCFEEYREDIVHWSFTQFRYDDSVYRRDIEFTQDRFGFSYDITDQHNHVLQKAVLMYISTHSDLTFSDGRLRLVEKFEKVRQGQRYDCDGDDESDPSIVTQLKSFDMLTIPPMEKDINVGSGIQLRIHYEEMYSREMFVVKNTTSFEIKAEGADAKTRVDKFVESAFEWYKRQERPDKDNTRYMYEIRRINKFQWQQDNNDGRGDSNNGDRNNITRNNTPKNIRYRRYPISENKTFASLFFEHKKMLLRMLRHFALGEGKSAIPSYPKQLSLLLNGPPGTGKTSLIKALAQYTGRHIVNLPLSRIRTNQELADMVFDQCYDIGTDLPVRHTFDQVIFVMEDIDCVSNIVSARDPNRKDALCKRIGQIKMDSALARKDALFALAFRLNNRVAARETMQKQDRLNLAGLLNVLDGVVDCPGRIMVMTTKHVEKIDPILIRPGRVNMTIQLGYIQAKHVIDMVNHYFANELSDDIKSIIERISTLSKRLFTPAEIEELCGQCDTVEDFVKWFERASLKIKC
eukprot:CFRG4181T1